MQCPFCNFKISEIFAESIDLIDGECPSSCNDAFSIVVECPQCTRHVFNKHVIAEYATRMKLPEFVKVIKNSGRVSFDAHTSAYVCGRAICVTDDFGNEILKIHGNQIAE